MSVKDLPFNIELFAPTLEHLRTLKQVRSLDIFESSSKNFHTDGLFSIEIFGKSGSEERNRTFGYIDIQAPILHPVLYKALTELKELYGDIMSGKKYAVWDKSIRDFDTSNAVDGQTGMAFFLEHWQSIKFPDRDSVKRKFNIALVEKYKSKDLIRYVLVLPAGMRDYEVGESGKPEEGEVNVFYRKLLSLSNLISLPVFKSDPSGVDNTRHQLQMTMIDIYNYYRGLLEGKSKYVQQKWVARKVFNSTRNVASTISHEASTADDPGILKANETAVGLHQYARASAPMSLHHIRETFLAKIFPGPNSPAVLVNPKTLKKELVTLDNNYYDDWMSADGLDNVIARFGERDIRHDVLTIGKYYMGLLYKGPDKTYRFMQDIDELPEDRSPEHVHPITFCELMYLSLYKDAHTVPAFVTRYPIASYGSIYPSLTHLKSTMPFESRVELDEAWQTTEHVAHNFPITGESFFDTVAVAQSHLARLALDYDGDVISYTCLITDEAKAEIQNKLNSAAYYVDANGKMYFSANTDTIDYVLSYITG